MRYQPGILARGPWPAERVEAIWCDEQFEAEPRHDEEADQRISDLADRGSPSHDGLGARLAAFVATEDSLRLELQPTRWGLRLVEGDASGSLTALCITRDSEGRWLAGRRAEWLATWAGKWALGAGGSVEVNEDPVACMSRELAEEWSVQPERLQIEALVALPHNLVMLVGQAWLADGAEVVADDEHDEHAWWPADPELWPEEADPQLKRLALLLR